MKMQAAAAPGAAPATANPAEGEKKKINQELWQACSGPLVNLPAAGTHVVYFPQGHSEQVAASMKKDVNGQMPNYPNLPPKLLCLLHNVTLHADPETDEVYAQMTLQPVPSFDKDALLRSDLSMKINKPQTEFFCKTLTASDTSTHGGFSVPRRAAEKIFPPLDFTMQPPAQELIARDLHDNVWTFRHIYRGQPKRHLLTTGWSLFVSGKRLLAGDSVLFIRDEKQQLLLGIRRANRQPTNLSSSVLSSDSMHIGILAAASHAAANNSPFTVFYNPRASPSEFVIPLAKYYKAVCSNQISLGMRFRMMFETEESGTRRYMGTITGITDLDPVRWKNSQWRNLQVGWDEATTGERRNRVSIWEIEPVTAPFFICPTPPFFRSKRPRIPGMPDDDTLDLDTILKRTMPWLGDDIYMKDPQSLPGLSLVQWMNMQQNSQISQPTNYLNSISNGPVLQNYVPPDPARQLGLPPPQIPIQNAINFNSQNLSQHPSQVTDITNQTNINNNFINQNLPSSQIMQPQQQISNQNQQLNRNISQNFSQNITQAQIQPPHDQINPQINISENQMQLQLLRKLQQQQQQSLLSQQTPILDTSQNIIQSNNQLLNISQQIKYQPPSQPSEINRLTNQLSTGGSSLMTGNAGGVSGITDEIPSCSTSPSTNNNLNSSQPKRNIAINGEEMMSFNQFENISNNKPRIDIKSSINVSQNQSQTVPPQIDYLESTWNHNHDIELLHGDLMNNNFQFGTNIMPKNPETLMTKEIVGPEKDFSNNLSSGDVVISNYEGIIKDNQPQLSSSMVSQSFGVPDVAFGSIDSTINDNNNFINRGAWAPAPQFPRMRTYTKVYKRGAVGRSIDMSRYGGYEELKDDVARMFGIEGQLEDRQRVGWKLVYVDHESDVLLLGDDPWEEFVNCVRCIKILSPQEVQAMSLDGDLGNNVLQTQDCSSSDGGNL